MTDLRLEITGLSAGYNGVAVVRDQRRGGLERHAGREEALHDGVVEVAADALTVLDQPQLLRGYPELLFGFDAIADVAHERDIRAPASVATGWRRLHENLDRYIDAIATSVHHVEHRGRRSSGFERG